MGASSQGRRGRFVSQIRGAPTEADAKRKSPEKVGPSSGLLKAGKLTRTQLAPELGPSPLGKLTHLRRHPLGRLDQTEIEQTISKPKCGLVHKVIVIAVGADRSRRLYGYLLTPSTSPQILVR